MKYALRALVLWFTFCFVALSLYAKEIRDTYWATIALSALIGAVETARIERNWR